MPKTSQTPLWTYERNHQKPSIYNVMCGNICIAEVMHSPDNARLLAAAPDTAVERDTLKAFAEKIASMEAVDNTDMASLAFSAEEAIAICNALIIDARKLLGWEA